MYCCSRGLECISQAFAKPSRNDYEQVEDRIQHVKLLVDRLLRQQNARPELLPQPTVSDPETKPSLFSQSGLNAESATCGCLCTLRLTQSQYPA
ncbi:uncharacterized protein BP01DRAFT_359009 [Aspergillus saccharolyticus JOP 1030-1]|uniref:Uncharacterized protein n=1 Tax=Aspergillus saccharolyticus JOP 1030-1 TaxID=1450539 RepID=A0A318Z7B2_9EURO|nr:hypothetical protein BP01DRAFT_359009 [Aspergillus saccharolyticus JOP 1030-1]PYH43046.1 hypothetical protein BP01DRAFT_359009 [Aspergillus saccharolyticus JOP 1030-1]